MWSIISKKRCQLALIWWVLIDYTVCSANGRWDVEQDGQWESEKIAQSLQHDGLWLICFLLLHSIIILPKTRTVTWKDDIISCKILTRSTAIFIPLVPQSLHFPPKSQCIWKLQILSKRKLILRCTKIAPVNRTLYLHPWSHQPGSKAANKKALLTRSGQSEACNCHHYVIREELGCG